MSCLRRRASSPGRIALALLGIELAVSLVLGVVGAVDRRESGRSRPVVSGLAESLQLTDLALCSSASYCRHPSQADAFSAHGEHPAAPDHFPAGSIISPLRANDAGPGWSLEASGP